MVPVQRDAILLVAETAATAIIPAATAIRAMVAATHALHIHKISFILVRLLGAGREEKTPSAQSVPGKN
jgi:hypothetical protein